MCHTKAQLRMLAVLILFSLSIILVGVVVLAVTASPAGGLIALAGAYLVRDYVRQFRSLLPEWNAIVDGDRNVRRA